MASPSMSVGVAAPAHRVDSVFRAMGSTAHVVVVAADPATATSLLDEARRRIEQLERRWSRFVAASEISRMNGYAGVPVVVSADTFLLVDRAVEACVLTDGRCNPLVGSALTALGYDRDFASMAESHRSVRPFHADYRPTPADLIRLDRHLPAVTMPAGVAFDPGGIGKGLAADLVVAELIGAGALGAMVNLGGDMAIAGVPPDEHGWIVGIEDPSDSQSHLARVTVVAGGVCTSSRLLRTWTTPEGVAAHHLVDPGTGLPVRTALVSVTVVAGAGWWAEALTKLLFVAGPDAFAEHLGAAHALLVFEDGTVQTLGDDGVFDRQTDRRLGT